MAIEPHMSGHSAIGMMQGESACFGIGKCMGIINGHLAVPSAAHMAVLEAHIRAHQCENCQQPPITFGGAAQVPAVAQQHQAVVYPVTRAYAGSEGD